MYSYVIYGFYYGKLGSLDFWGFGSSVMWHFVTGFMVHSISEAVQSFETLGSANTLTCHHVTEDLSQKSECETLNITLDYCTVCSLHFESRTFTQYSLSHTCLGYFFLYVWLLQFNEWIILCIKYCSWEPGGPNVWVCVGGMFVHVSWLAFPTPVTTTFFPVIVVSAWLPTFCLICSALQYFINIALHLQLSFCLTALFQFFNTLTFAVHI